MLNIWASQQQGVSPAPPVPVSVNDFANDVYSRGGVPTTYLGNWDTSSIGNLTKTAGVGIVAEYGATSASGTLTSTGDLFATVNPIHGYTAVLSVDVIDTSQNNQAIASRLIAIDLSAPFSRYRVEYQSGSLGKTIQSDAYDGVAVIDINQYTNNPTRAPHIIAATFTPTRRLLSVDGGPTIEVAGTLDTLASLDAFQLYMFALAAGSKMITKQANFYRAVVNPEQLQALST